MLIAALNAAKLSEPGLRAAQGAAVRKAQWLADWKSRLISDLNTTHFSGTISDTVGAQYSGVDGANAQNLAVKIGAYGSAQVPWTKFTARTLLDISVAVAKTDPERQWLAAVFAAETGQADTARSLGEAAAKTKQATSDAVDQTKKAAKKAADKAKQAAKDAANKVNQ